jgi:hypothetical protein
LQRLISAATIECVKKKSPRNSTSEVFPQGGPFSPGALVIVTLANPRNKFWGMILRLAPEGLSLSGVELASVEDLAAMVKDGEPFTPAVVFLPMHRVERVDLDLPNGNLPSLSDRFFASTGLQPLSLMAEQGARVAMPGGLQLVSEAATSKDRK